MDQNIEKLQQIINESKSIVIFTGAGISVPSGIPDFRSATGLYNTSSGIGYRPEEIISHSFFMRNAEDFYKFYKEKMCYEDAKPNAAHAYFAKLEQAGKLLATVTQNIDGLHQAAGSKVVYELHGSIHRNYCMKCGASYSLDYVLRHKGVPKCDKCGGTIKPDVVLYEEGLDMDVISGAVNAISRADTLVIIGTSLVVYPAAGFINYFRGKNLVLINKSETGADYRASLVIHEDCAKVCEQLEVPK
ncbi:MAG: NAD-dependent protein deacylase [Clostridia bacterium]|nr:NAD-dependent protein deacylase [Clostridia bacterium]